MNQDLIDLKNKAKQVAIAMDQLPADVAKNISSSDTEKEFGSNVKERLNNMREDFGDELFDKVAGGGSLMHVLDRWVGEKVQESVIAMIDSIHATMIEHGHDKITREHVSAFIEVGISSRM